MTANLYTMNYCKSFLHRVFCIVLIFILINIFALILGIVIVSLKHSLAVGLRTVLYFDWDFSSQFFSTCGFYLETTFSQEYFNAGMYWKEQFSYFWVTMVSSVPFLHPSDSEKTLRRFRRSSYRQKCFRNFDKKRRGVPPDQSIFCFLATHFLQIIQHMTMYRQQIRLIVCSIIFINRKNVR